MVKKSRLKNSGCFLSLAIVVGAYVILSLLSFGHMLGRKYVSLFVPVCCYIVASLGLNLNIGISGELNLGQAGFMAIGAFTAAVVSGYMTFITTAPTFVIVVLSILAGTVLSALISWLISVPVLRLRGDYLAIVTLAFGQIIVSLLNNIYLGVDQNGLHFSFINHSFVLAEGKGIHLRPDGCHAGKSAGKFYNRHRAGHSGFMADLQPFRCKRWTGNHGVPR